MTYNHKASRSLVQQARDEGKEVKTANIHIDEIQRKPAKGGNYVITLVDADTGRKYSAFENIWDLQNIPVEQIDEGDGMTLQYVCNPCGDYEYHNFLSVVLDKAAINEPSEGLPF